MKNQIISSLRTAALIATLATLSVSAHAKDSAPVSRADQALAQHGRVAVAKVGSSVEIGTFQIQVSVTLGRPTKRLTDGSWLYSNYEIEQSAAKGSLLVNFQEKRVSALTLVSPAIATALLSPQKPVEKIRVTANK